jgi:hypothetical protein
MATKVKPVQPTEIRDKEIARQIIEQIRKPIPASVYRRHEKLKQIIKKMTRRRAVALKQPQTTLLSQCRRHKSCSVGIGLASA